MKEGDLVSHKKYGVGIVIEVREVYSSWGHPNIWYRVAFAYPIARDNPRWMSPNNLEAIYESG